MKSEEFEEELKTMFRPQLISNQSGKNIRGTSILSKKSNSKNQQNIVKSDSPEPLGANNQSLSNYKSTDTLLSFSKMK